MVKQQLRGSVRELDRCGHGHRGRQRNDYSDEWWRVRNDQYHCQCAQADCRDRSVANGVLHVELSTREVHVRWVRIDGRPRDRDLCMGLRRRLGGGKRQNLDEDVAHVYGRGTIHGETYRH